MVETRSGWFRPQEELMGTHNGKAQSRTRSGMAGSRGSNHALESWLCLTYSSFCVGLVLGKFMPPAWQAKRRERQLKPQEWSSFLFVISLLSEAFNIYSAVFNIGGRWPR